MKRIVLAAVGVMLLGTPAFAADMAARTYTKAPAIAASVYNWGGFYAYRGQGLSQLIKFPCGP